MNISNLALAHPKAIAALGYVVTGLLVAIFHARSSEEYSSRPPRVAALFKLLASIGCDAPKVWRSIVYVVNAGTPAARATALLGILAGFTIDPAKALEALYQIITGTRREDPQPPASGGPGLLVFLTFAVFGACAPAPATPRDEARSTVLLLSSGVATAVGVCAELSLSHDDLALAQTCANAYDVARPALLGAEKAIDGWDSGAAGDVACAAVRAADALGSMLAAIRAAGGAAPPAAEDALKRAPTLAGVCRG